MGSPHSPPCPRCHSQEPVTRPWAGFRLVRVLWIGGLCVILALAPVLASDLFVMTPLSVLYLFAGGPVMGLARLRPACINCGLERPRPGWHEVPCRPVGSLPRAHVERRVAARETRAVESSGVHTLPRRRGADEGR